MSPRTTAFVSTHPSSIGIIGVAWSDAGVRGIEIGESDDHAVGLLTERDASCLLERVDDTRLPAMVAEIIEHPSRPVPPALLCLDLTGTPFQQRVWRLLMEIPAGSRVTYAELAAKLGDVGLVRAVGAACVANRHAIVIPCHRVLRSDGDLAGYRWGVERKSKLLRREAEGVGVGLFG